VTTGEAGSSATGTAERIQLVDEDDAGRLFPRLLKQVPHSGGPDADEHLDEFRATDREEGYASLTRHRPRQQRLAGSGGADEQNPLRLARAEPAITLRVLEERDGLFQLVLRLVDAGHVVERRPCVLLDIDLGLALADGHQAAHAASLRHAADHEEPEQGEEADRHDPGKDVAQPGALHVAVELDVVLLQFIGEVRVHPCRSEPLDAVFVGLAKFALDRVLGDGDPLDPALLERCQEIAVRDVLDARLRSPDALDQQDRHHGDHEIPEVYARLSVHSPARFPCRVNEPRRRGVPRPAPIRVSAAAASGATAYTAIAPVARTHAEAATVDTTVMGSPTTAKSRKVSRIPASIARSATIRLARLPVRRRLPASVLKSASPWRVPGGRSGQRFRIRITAGTLPIVLLAAIANGASTARLFGESSCSRSHDSHASGTPVRMKASFTTKSPANSTSSGTSIRPSRSRLRLERLASRTAATEIAASARSTPIAKSARRAPTAMAANQRSDRTRRRLVPRLSECRGVAS